MHDGVDGWPARLPEAADGRRRQQGAAANVHAPQRLGASGKVNGSTSMADHKHHAERVCSTGEAAACVRPPASVVGCGGLACRQRKNRQGLLRPPLELGHRRRANKNHLHGHPCILLAVFFRRHMVPVARLSPPPWWPPPKAPPPAAPCTCLPPQNPVTTSPHTSSCPRNAAGPSRAPSHCATGRSAAPGTPQTSHRHGLMVLPEDKQQLTGTSFILQWFESFFSGDEYSRAATRRVLLEVRDGAGGRLCHGGVAAALAAATPSHSRLTWHLHPAAACCLLCAHSRRFPGAVPDVAIQRKVS